MLGEPCRERRCAHGIGRGARARGCDVTRADANIVAPLRQGRGQRAAHHAGADDADPHADPAAGAGAGALPSDSTEYTIPDAKNPTNQA